MEKGTGRERDRERARGCRLVDVDKVGTGTEAVIETRALAELGKGNRTGAGA